MSQSSIYSQPQGLPRPLALLTSINSLPPLIQDIWPYITYFFFPISSSLDTLKKSKNGFSALLSRLNKRSFAPQEAEVTTATMLAPNSHSNNDSQTPSYEELLWRGSGELLWVRFKSRLWLCGTLATAINCPQPAEYWSSHHCADQTKLGNDLSHDGQTVNPCNGTGDGPLFWCWDCSMCWLFRWVLEFGGLLSCGCNSDIWQFPNQTMSRQ